MIDGQECGGRPSNSDNTLNISGRYKALEDSDLRRLECASAVTTALDWIGENLGYFDPAGHDNRLDRIPTKAFFELAMMLSCYVTITGDRSSQRIRQVVDLLEITSQHRPFLDRFLRSPHTLVQVLHLYIAYRTVIGENPELRALIQRAVAYRFDSYIERPPHRLMEVRMSLDWAEINHSLPPWNSLYQDSILADVPSPLFLRQEGIYQLTHVVMFATRFGLNSALLSDVVTSEAVRDLLSDLIVAMCHENHWDLLGELLLCWDCLRLASSTIYSRAWDAFLQTQNEDGSFTPPATTARRYDDRLRRSGESVEPEYRAFVLSYHTTLVAVIAGCCRLQRAGASNLVVDSFTASSDRSTS